MPILFERRHIVCRALIVEVFYIDRKQTIKTRVGCENVTLKKEILPSNSNSRTRSFDLFVSSFLVDV